MMCPNKLGMIVLQDQIQQFVFMGTHTVALGNPTKKI